MKCQSILFKCGRSFYIQLTGFQSVLPAESFDNNRGDCETKSSFDMIFKDPFAFIAIAEKVG